MYIIKYLYYNFYKIHKAMSGKKAGPEDGSDNFASWATGLPLLPNVITTQMLFHKITGIDIRDTMFPFDIFIGVLSLILIIYLLTTYSNEDALEELLDDERLQNGKHGPTWAKSVVSGVFE